MADDGALFNSGPVKLTGGLSKYGSGGSVSLQAGAGKGGGGRVQIEGGNGVAGRGGDLNFLAGSSLVQLAGTDGPSTNRAGHGGAVAIVSGNGSLTSGVVKISSADVTATGLANQEVASGVVVLATGDVDVKGTGLGGFAGDLTFRSGLLVLHPALLISIALGV